MAKVNSIQYEAAKFPASIAKAGHCLVSDAKMIHAATTVGVAPAGSGGSRAVRTALHGRARAGHRSLAELIWRVAMTDANLVRQSTGFMRSDGYMRLDPSEKSAVSYFLGMVQAKIIAGDVLNISHLVHLDSLPSFSTATRSRPDFYGIDWSHPKTCYFLEAKGRTMGYSASVVAKAKKQTTLVTHHPNFDRLTGIASLSYFNRNGFWTSYLEDPPAESKTSPNAPSAGSLYASYYTPIIDAMTNADVDRQDSSIRTAYIDAFDFQLSCPTSVFDLLTSKQNDTSRSELPEALNEELSRPRNKLEGYQDGSSNFTGSDGIRIELGPSWSSNADRATEGNES
ncbi:hypothetical protein [Rhodococcoides fascians]|uniref:hypothetical protein n=2 Tax=Rhodococcoides fascians TaxID=1828 RepID=UPI001114E122|nr:hypothetical protein [Rhodococcus fascians]